MRTSRGSFFIEPAPSVDDDVGDELDGHVARRHVIYRVRHPAGFDEPLGSHRTKKAPFGPAGQHGQVDYLSTTTGNDVVDDSFPFVI